MGWITRWNDQKSWEQHQKHSKLVQRPWRHLDLSLRSDKERPLLAHQKESEGLLKESQNYKAGMLQHVSSLNLRFLHHRLLPKVPQQGVNQRWKVLLLSKKRHIFLHMQWTKLSHPFPPSHSSWSRWDQNRHPRPILSIIIKKRSHEVESSSF